jgi:Cdc6-like AAA superfamily ATPase
MSGDARQALYICRRATELAEMDTTNTDGIVTMQDVEEALLEMIISICKSASYQVNVSLQLIFFLFQNMLSQTDLIVISSEF